jgi:hypothetical protein
MPQLPPNTCQVLNPVVIILDSTHLFGLLPLLTGAQMKRGSRSFDYTMSADGLILPAVRIAMHVMVYCDANWPRIIRTAIDQVFLVCFSTC